MSLSLIAVFGYATMMQRTVLLDYPRENGNIRAEIITPEDAAELDYWANYWNSFGWFVGIPWIVLTYFVTPEKSLVHLIPEKFRNKA